MERQKMMFLRTESETCETLEREFRSERKRVTLAYYIWKELAGRCEKYPYRCESERIPRALLTVSAPTL